MLIRNPTMLSYKLSNRQSARRKIDSYCIGADAGRIWKGLKPIMDYKGNPSHELPSDASLPDELNAV